MVRITRSAGTGPTVEAGEVNSASATDGQLLTANGSGGAAWETLSIPHKHADSVATQALGAEADYTGVTVTLDRNGLWLIFYGVEFEVTSTTACYHALHVDGVASGVQGLSYNPGGENGREGPHVGVAVATIAAQPKVAKVRVFGTATDNAKQGFITAVYLGPA